MTYVMISAEKKLIKKKGTFELLGCDILIDNNFNPFLLEMNLNPALFTGIYILYYKFILKVLIKFFLDT